MVEFIDDNKIRVKVANTDAISNNQIKRIKNINPETVSYYIKDSDPNRDKIMNFVNSVGELTVSTENQKEVLTFLKEKVLPNYRYMYVDNMNYIQSLTEEELEEIKSIKLKTTGERGYLAFDKESNYEGVLKIKKMLFGDYMWFDVFRNGDGGFIQMGFDENKIEEIFNTKYKMDLKDLSNILKEKYTKEENDNTHDAVLIWFGYSFSSYLNEYDIIEILKRAGINENKKIEIEKGVALTKILQSTSFEESIIESNLNKNTVENYIYYGVPGCGKSYAIDKLLKDKDLVRTIFHPDYTYSDFVGQVVPKSKGENISYEFRAGAFLQALEKAFNSDNEVALVIEEINRGNASAIFGDVFQLLDRKANGESQYPIYNKDAYEYLIDKVPEHVKHRYLIRDNYIMIPDNLSIYATMNTSDQNVFTLDTAFKRRWQMKYIPNDISKCTFRNNEVCGTGISWETFMLAINRKIANDSKSILNTEDKRLGAWFVKENELNDKDVFAEKVLMYIWNDMAKLNRKDWFTVKTYDELITTFKEKGMEVFKNYTTLFNLNEEESTIEENNQEEIN